MQCYVFQESKIQSLHDTEEKLNGQIQVLQTQIDRMLQENKENREATPEDISQVKKDNQKLQRELEKYKKACGLPLLFALTVFYVM